jgi:hypothetical protein
VASASSLAFSALNSAGGAGNVLIPSTLVEIVAEDTYSERTASLCATAASVAPANSKIAHPVAPKVLLMALLLLSLKVQ